MAQPFLGDIRMFAGNFAPLNFHFCDGSLLAISEYDALFSLIGTTYGGDGITNFALPDLRGRLPLHYGSALGSSFVMGAQSGTETVTLTGNQIPSHTHSLNCNGTPSANLQSPSSALPGKGLKHYRNLDPDTALSGAAVSNAGGNQPHANTMPTLAVHYIIAVQGVYPSRP